MRFLLILAIFAALTGCIRRKEVWIYTSLPKEVIADLVDPLQAAVPQGDVKWYQSASDNVANRVSAELEAGHAKADLVLTSDPLWYYEMKQKGRLLAYDSPAAKEVPAGFRDPDQMFTAIRIPIMVMAYNSQLLKATELPERWKDLALPRLDRRVSMGSPLESASSFVVLGVLSKLYGWGFFSELRRQGMVAEGMNSSALMRVQTGERAVGILPLEAALRAGDGGRNHSVKAIYPLDGAIPIPGSIAILKSTEHSEIAQQVYDWFFSAGAQATLVHAGAYSPLPKGPVPEGAKPWAEIEPQLIKWNSELLHELFTGRDRIRAKFSEVVFH